MQAMVDGGMLGRKSGRGFYVYGQVQYRHVQLWHHSVRPKPTHERLSW